MINKTDAENVAEMIIEYVDHINRTYPGYTGSYNYTGSQYIFNIDGDSIIELNHINIACSGKFEVIIDMDLCFFAVVDKNNSIPCELMECGFNGFDMDSFKITST